MFPVQSVKSMTVLLSFGALRKWALSPLGAISELGQSRRLGDVRVPSALPPKTDIHRKERHVSKVPYADIQEFRRALLAR